MGFPYLLVAPSSKPSIKPTSAPSSIPTPFPSLVGYTYDVSYNTSGTYTFLVPIGVTSMLVNMCGASGGNGYNVDVGGLGGCISSTIDVQGPLTLTINVGGAGGNSASSCPVPGGFNGGGK